MYVIAARNVVSMSAMFADATSFTGTQGGGSMAKWNVEQVRSVTFVPSKCGLNVILVNAY